jgi:hypothetical protein
VRPFVHQNDLPDVVADMRCADQEQPEAILNRVAAVLDRGRQPRLALRMERPHHHADRLPEADQQGLGGGAGWVGELSRTVTHVPSPGDPRPDVVVEAAGEMDHDAADAVAEAKRPDP